jgi:hypothetical protein
MDKQLLEDLVANGCSQRSISRQTGKSHTDVRYWLKKYDLQTARVTGKEKYQCACGENRKEYMHDKGDGRKHHSKCKACHSRYNVARMRDSKLKAVEYKGGKCELCGYCNCVGSLHFHHKDPSQKDPNWKKMKGWKFDRIKQEIDKCLLVCANCHGELHWN